MSSPISLPLNLGALASPANFQNTLASYLQTQPVFAFQGPDGSASLAEKAIRHSLGAPLYATKFPSWNVLSLFRHINETAGRAWEVNTGTQDPAARFERIAAVQERLKNVEAAGGNPLLNSLRRFWNEIPYATAHTSYPRIATPAESAIGHIEGLLMLRQTWGDSVADCWREGDFLEKAAQCGFPEASYRESLDGDFSLTRSPGSHETVGGIDYRLHWKGRDTSGAQRDVLLATVGFIRRRDGFGITLVQGGPKLTAVKTDGKSKRGDLLRLVQKRFGGDPRAWLVGKVLRRLTHDYPASPLYWLQAERRAPLYCHILDPFSPRNTLFPSVGTLSLDDLRTLVGESKRASQKRTEGDHRWSLEEATRLPGVIERLNNIAKTFGFRPEDGNDAWWVL